MSRKMMVWAAITGFGLSLLFQNCSGGQGGITQDINGGSLSKLSSVDPSVHIQLGLKSGTLISTPELPVQFSVRADRAQGLKLRCFLNNIEMQLCESPLMLTPTAEGDHSFRVRVETENGRVLAEKSATFRWDSTPPVLILHQIPAEQIGTTTTSIQYTAFDNLSGLESVECSLDGSDFSPCTDSPASFMELTAGNHLIKMRAKDKAGHYSPVKEVSFNVNLGMPILTITQKPEPLTNGAQATFAFVSVNSEEGTKFQCSFDHANFQDCKSPITYGPLTSGTHLFAVRTINSAQKTSEPVEFTFVVDRDGPTTPVIISNLTSPTRQNSAVISFSASDPSGVARYECKLDTGSYQTCTSPKIFRELTSGNRVFQVRAIDHVGNVSQEGGLSLMVDLDKPVAHLTATPDFSTKSREAAFAFNVSDSLSGLRLVECRLDAGNFEVCSEQQTYSGLESGRHEFTLRVTDNAGNVREIFYEWTIRAPDTGLSEGVFQSAASAFCLGSEKIETNAGAFHTRCSDPQRLEIKEVVHEDGQVIIQVKNSTLCLDVLGHSKEIGSPIGIFTCHNGENQSWRKIANDDGTFVYQSIFSGLCLESDFENILRQKPCEQSLRQNFKIVHPPPREGESIIASDDEA